MAGWRPLIGWFCGLAVGFKFIGGPALFIVTQTANQPIDLPLIEIAEPWLLLLRMLGLKWHSHHREGLERSVVVAVSVVGGW